MSSTPALDAFMRAIRDAAHPLVAWMTTEGPDAVGLHNPWPELAAEMEAEGAAKIGAKPCTGIHGDELSDGRMVWFWGAKPCPDCGAAL